MKIIVYTLLVYLACTAAAFGQIKGNGFGVKYDKFKDETTAIVKSNEGPAALTLWFTVPGTDLKSDVETFNLAISGRCRGFCFNGSHIIFLIDGERVELTPNSNDLSDEIVYSIDRTMLSRIANARKVEYQAAAFEDKWRSFWLGRIKNLIAGGTVDK